MSDELTPERIELPDSIERAIQDYGDARVRNAMRDSGHRLFADEPQGTADDALENLRARLAQPAPDACLPNFSHDYARENRKCIHCGKSAPAATSAQPVAAAGSEPVAWRGRDHMGQPWTLSLSEKALHQLGFVLVEPLYATPTPALAPQDGGLRAAAQALVDYRQRYGHAPAHYVDQVIVALAAPAEPDVLPGLKLAEKIVRQNIEAYGPSGKYLAPRGEGNTVGLEYADAIGSEIARREGAST